MAAATIIKSYVKEFSNLSDAKSSTIIFDIFRKSLQEEIWRTSKTRIHLNQQKLKGNLCGPIVEK